MDIVLTFIFLRLMLVFIFILTGYFLSGEDGKKHYWLCSLPAIVAFSLIEGLRYDRGVDYFHYKKLFENSLNLSVYYDIDSIEPLFQIINKVIKILGLSYPVVFVFYSFILIFAGFFFLRQYKDCAPFLVPLFFLAIVTPAENIVRQFVAIAFVLIALSFFNSKQWIKFCSFILFAFLTHYSSIVLLPFILLFSKFGVFLVKKKIVLITILTLFILSFFWKIEYWSHIYNYIPVLNFGSGRYQSYLERSHIWFSGEQTLDYVSNLTMFNSIRTFFLNFIILTIGYLKLDKTSGDKFIMPYFLFAIGTIFEHIAIGMELPIRILTYFYLFWFIVVGYIIKQSKNKASIIICVILAILILYTYIVGPLLKTNPSGSLFIWDI